MPIAPVPTLSSTVAAADTANQLPSTFDIVFPLTILLVIGLAIPTGMVVLNHFLSRMAHGTRNTSPGKHVPYEAGISATVGGSDERISVKFYLIAMLFLAFDLEVAFLYPWAIWFNKAQGWGVVWLLVVFLVMLEVGYLYLYKKGALDWDK